jgi:hypothetical protein
MRGARRVGVLAFTAMVLGAAPAFAAALFSDNTFALGNYSASPNFSSDPSASITYLQCASCGNPGNALQFTSTMTVAGTILLAQGLVNTGFSYNPLTQGAIASISASVDKNISVDFAGVGIGNTFRPTIEQNGIFYLAAIPGTPFNGPNAPAGAGYQNISNGALLAADFINFDFTTGVFGSAHPNFAGNSILLGLTQITGINGSSGHLVTQYDNLSFAVTNVPEPFTLSLFGTGLAGAVAMRRRKKKTAG